MDKPAWQAKFREQLTQSTYLLQRMAPGLTYGALATAAPGNVWEWCSTQWLGNYKDYTTKVNETLAADKRRVVRGGSFDNLDYSVCCAARNFNFPYNEREFFGFRVVLSPFTPGL